MIPGGWPGSLATGFWAFCCADSTISLCFAQPSQQQKLLARFAGESPNLDVIEMHWLRLLRIPALPTAVSNVMMAFLIAGGTDYRILTIAVVASSALYLGGMVLNDWFDQAQDQIERPSRPIPSGKIKPATAATVGFGLLATGVVISAIAGNLVSPTSWLPPSIALLLSTFILLYDGPLKKTAVGPVLMGSCRLLNILLAASFVVAWPDIVSAIQSLTPLTWTACSIGILITGITWFARNEAVTNQSARLIPPAVCTSIGLMGLIMITSAPSAQFATRVANVFPWIMLAITVPIFRALFNAIRSGEPADIGKAVVAVLRSLIIMDAAICLLVAPDQIGYCLTVLALLIPSLFLGKWVYST